MATWIGRGPLRLERSSLYPVAIDLPFLRCVQRMKGQNQWLRRHRLINPPF